MRHLLATFVLALSLAGCTTYAPPYPPVPPPLAESLPLPPLSPRALSWQPGSWNWTGRDYVWMAGRYVDRAGHGPFWQVGFWTRGPGGWVWVPPHWS